MKIATFFGTIGGAITPVVIDWGNIAQRVIETCAVSFFGGLFGAVGGLLIAWLANRFFKIKKG